MYKASNEVTKFKFTASNYNILIVDDSTSMNKMLTKSFNKDGFICHNAFSLMQARDILKTKT